MFEILLLALALAADAFAAAIGLGSTHRSDGKSQFIKMALLIGLYFGVAQGVMPLINWLCAWLYYARLVCGMGCLDRFYHTSGSWD